MKKIDLGQTISIVANIGVIAGIVFLAVEIGQNKATLDEQNAINRQSSRDAALENYGTFRRLLLENDELYELWTNAMGDDELTPVDRSKFTLLCLESIWVNVTSYVRFDSLGLDEAARTSIDLLAGEIARSKNFGHCWDEQKEVVIARGYGAFVDSVDSSRNAERATVP
jgi:hypothetical protein